MEKYVHTTYHVLLNAYNVQCERANRQPLTLEVFGRGHPPQQCALNNPSEYTFKLTVHSWLTLGARHWLACIETALGKGGGSGSDCRDRVYGVVLNSYGKCPTSSWQVYNTYVHVTSRTIASNRPVHVGYRVLCEDPVLSPHDDDWLLSRVLTP